MKQGTGGPTSTLIRVTDQSQVGEARRAAGVISAAAGMSETERGALAVVVTEIATNLANHATEGVIALRAIGSSEASGVEVLALDKGPGIRDLPKAMTDGFSTGGTAGKGLGAVQRMSSEFDLFSGTSGTALLSRVWSAAGLKQRREQPSTEGVVCTPIANETACGDGWMVLHGPTSTLAVIVDGLGHGVEAAKAADTALRIVRGSSALPPAQQLEAAHSALRATRGAAMAIARIVPGEGVVRFAGIGNISGVIVSPDGTRNLASHNGTVGHTAHKVQEFTYPWTPDACLIMFSDGIMSRWKLEPYPGLAARHPALVSGVLFRDFLRGRDDATVLAVRHRRLQD